MKRPSSLLIASLLFLATFALYAKAAHFPFLFLDDADYVTGNPHVTAGLSVDSLKWAFTAFHANNWHPVTWISLMVDSEFFGTNPMGYHLVNVFYHALNGALLFLLFHLMTGALWRSAFVAACFAFHPLHVESVAWISERKDVLSALFWIVTLLFYASYVKSSRRSMYLLSVTAFAVGLMAKPMLVTLPVVLLLLDFWPLGRLRMPLPDASERHLIRYLLLEKIPFAALAAVSSVITVSAQGTGGAVVPLWYLSLPERIGNALWSVIAYMGKMLLPVNLSIYYPFAGLPFWKTGGAVIALIGISLFVAATRNRYPYLAVGWLWYLVTLAPVIGIIQVGEQAMADRYTYIPSIGFFTMLCWGGGELCARFPKLNKAICSAATVAVFLLAATTWGQLGHWQNDIRLVTHGLEVTEDNYFLQSTLGDLYQKEGRLDLAAPHYKEAIRIAASAKQSR